MTAYPRMVRGALAVLLLLIVPAATSAQSQAPLDSSPARSRLVWQLVNDPDVDALPSSAPFYEVAAGPSVLVALAAADCRPGDCIVVASSADGLDWEVSPDRLDGFPVDITWGPAGFLIVAFIDGDPVTYLSVDGRSWTPGPLDGLTAEDEPMSAVATSDGYMLVGCGDRQQTFDCSRGQGVDIDRWPGLVLQVPAEADGAAMAAAAAHPGHVVALAVSPQASGHDADPCGMGRPGRGSTCPWRPRCAGVPPWTRSWPRRTVGSRSSATTTIPRRTCPTHSC